MQSVMMGRLITPNLQLPTPKRHVGSLWELEVGSWEFGWL
jgi:hypothetical protein